MQIAVVAWGSLVWQPRNGHGELCTEPGAEWSNDGPALPIEFARISSDGRLTLVVVPYYDSATPTLWQFSCHPDLDAAIANLAQRETNAPLDRIHAVDAHGIRNGEADPAVAAVVTSWVADRPDVDAAIWTGLPPGPRWQPYGGFSPRAALDYVATLISLACLRSSNFWILPVEVLGRS